MGEFGDLLREAREKQGLSLKQIEEITRIRRVFLEALEEERFGDLPGDVYARGFIQTYARLLGLDPQRLLVAHRASTATSPTSIPRVLDEPLLRRSPATLWAGVFLGLMVILVLALAGWYGYNRFYLDVDPWPALIKPAASKEAPTAVVVTTVMNSPAAPEPTSTAGGQVVRPARTVLVASEDTATSPATVAEPSTGTATSRVTVTQVSEESPTPVPALTTRPTPTKLQVVRVEARVLKRTYVEVTADGEQILAGILEEGQDQIWTAEREISIRIGNAAGLRLTVNGVDMGPLGEDGSVIDVEYTLDTLP